jgi:virulence factor
MKSVRVLLVGAGRMANRVHYPSLSEMVDVELTALCDIDEQRLKETASRFGIKKTYTDFRKMFESEKADAAYILMPPLYHYDIVLAALRNKLHVFVEKPPAMTSFQMRSFILEEERNGVIGMVGFNRRFIPMIRYARDKVTEHGSVSQVVATFYKHQIPATFFDGAMDALTADGIHAVDTIRYLIGTEQEIVDLHTISAQYSDDVPNSWFSIMKFSNGATGILLTNYNVGGRVHTFEIHGPGISVFLNPNDEGMIIQEQGKQIIKSQEIAESKEFYKYYGFFQENRYFIDCIKAGKKPSSDFQDALKTLELVEQIRSKQESLSHF